MMPWMKISLLGIRQVLNFQIKQLPYSEIEKSISVPFHDSDEEKGFK